jgi:hypothetical protein
MAALSSNPPSHFASAQRPDTPSPSANMPKVEGTTSSERCEHQYSLVEVPTYAFGPGDAWHPTWGYYTHTMTQVTCELCGEVLDDEDAVHFMTEEEPVEPRSKDITISQHNSAVGLTAARKSQKPKSPKFWTLSGKLKAVQSYLNKQYQQRPGQKTYRKI